MNTKTKHRTTLFVRLRRWWWIVRHPLVEVACNFDVTSFTIDGAELLAGPVPAFVFVGYASWNAPTQLVSVSTTSRIAIEVANKAPKSLPFQAAVILTGPRTISDPIGATYVVPIGGPWVCVEAGARMTIAVVPVVSGAFARLIVAETMTWRRPKREEEQCSKTATK